MPEQYRAVLQFTLVAFGSLFALVDPFATIPAFIAMTEGHDREFRRRQALRASWTCFLVLTCFSLAGSFIFEFFGITLPAFEIAGGLILLLIGIDMLQARRSETQEVEPDRREGAAKEDVGITPLGIPMLAGPGAISTVMVLTGPQPKLWQAICVLAVIAVCALLSYLVLSAADRVRAVLGETGIRVLIRIMGLLLTAIAVQFFLNGFTHLGVLKKM